MKHRSVREEAMRSRYDSHIEKINRFVDDLREEGQRGMPYVDARYGGVDAEVLFLFQDPGPGTDADESGSGFLSPQNDDPSAELFLRCLGEADLTVERVITWNAYPWMMKTEQGLTVKFLEEGGEVLVRLFPRLPRLRVVMLMGRQAQKCWQRLDIRRPEITREYHVLESYHTSRRGITNGGQFGKDEGVAKVCCAMQEALRIIDIS